MTDEERLADIVSRVDMGLGDGRGDGADTMWLIAKVRELEATARTASEAASNEHPGHQCGVCLQWVPAFTIHSCSGGALRYGGSL